MMSMFLVGSSVAIRALVPKEYLSAEALLQVTPELIKYQRSFFLFDQIIVGYWWPYGC